jgi:hypothetical protein
MIRSCLVFVVILLSSCTAVEPVYPDRLEWPNPVPANLA